MYKKKPCNADGCDAPVPNMNAKSTGIWRYGKCYECQNKHKATAQALYDSSASRKKARRIKAGREVDDTAATAAATAATAAAAATAATAAAYKGTGKDRKVACLFHNSGDCHVGEAKCNYGHFCVGCGQQGCSISTCRQSGTVVGSGTPKNTKDTGQKLLGNTSDSSAAADGGN
jgi:hypothetical protein